MIANTLAANDTDAPLTHSVDDLRDIATKYLFYGIRKGRLSLKKPTTANDFTEAAYTLPTDGPDGVCRNEGYAKSTRVEHLPDGEYTVMTCYVIRTGQFREVVWKKGGKRHRADGPAVTTYDPSTGKIEKEEWYFDGERHHIGGPAILEYDTSTGVVEFEAWIQNGANHREGAPSRITRDPITGMIAREEWYRRGLSHNLHGPACIEREPRTGVIFDIDWDVDESAEDGGRLLDEELVRNWPKPANIRNVFEPS